jgi:hypothetical protein
MRKESDALRTVCGSRIEIRALQTIYEEVFDRGMV